MPSKSLLGRASPQASCLLRLLHCISAGKAATVVQRLTGCTPWGAGVMLLEQYRSKSLCCLYKRALQAASPVQKP